MKQLLRALLLVNAEHFELFFSDPLWVDMGLVDLEVAVVAANDESKPESKDSGEESKPGVEVAESKPGVEVAEDKALNLPAHTVKEGDRGKHRECHGHQRHYCKQCGVGQRRCTAGASMLEKPLEQPLPEPQLVSNGLKHRNSS